MEQNTTSFEELVNELKNAQAESGLDPDVDMDLFTDEEPVTPQISISDKIAQLTQALKPFRLSNKALQTMAEFMTFHLQVNKMRFQLPEAIISRFNLLVRCDDESLATQFGEILAQQMDVPSRNRFVRTEREILQSYEHISGKRRIGSSTAEPLIRPGQKFIFIRNCQEAPSTDPDLATSSAMDANRKKVEYYAGAWKEVLQYVQDHPGTVLLVHSNYDVYRNSLRRNSELFYRACSHHIFIRPLTEDELLQNCLEKLHDSSFTLSDGFEQKLTTYFRTVYPKAELRSMAFVDDLLRRIYSLYFSKERSDTILTPDCIPRFNPHVATVEDVLAQLDDLVGLESVKREFRDIYTRQLAGLNSSSKPRYHMLFTGNPGTGKTTVAQMAADLFYRMGVIRTNKLVMTSPTDLDSIWIGGAGTKTAEILRRAYDGVLFIDEAYGLTNNRHGSEVLNQLIQDMENHSDRLIVILAGYEKEMQDLMQINPGLASRISREVKFENYSLDELISIFHKQCHKEGFTLSPSADNILADCISGMMSREFFGNARDIGKLVQSLTETWSTEFYRWKQEDPQAEPEYVFYPHHFDKEMPPKKEVNISELVGLSALKEQLDAFRKQALYQRHLQQKGLAAFSDASMHMIFTGNPGTGKTTVARLIANDLYSLGVLKSSRLVVVERKDLISSIPGQTAKLAENVVKRAAGGVLFVDEAYALAAGNLGHEVIEVFLTAMEEHKKDTVFIFAGYSEEMQSFLAMNPGIQSRIGYTFHFENYSPDELTQMFRDKLTKSGFTISEKALEKVREIMEYFHSAKNFGNGRFVNHVIQQTITQRANRDFAQSYRDIDERDVPAIQTLITTAPDSMQLYDPATITQEEIYRTAIHELGHAIVSLKTDPACTPESISIRNRAGSLGRVRLTSSSGNLTEEAMLDNIAMLLAGKDAEKVFLGSHCTGCSSDFARARQIAEDMLQRYAMDSFGSTPSEIIKAADRRATEIIEAHRDAFAQCAQLLMEKKEISGSELAALLSDSPEQKA